MTSSLFASALNQAQAVPTWISSWSTALVIGIPTVCNNSIPVISVYIGGMPLIFAGILVFRAACTTACRNVEMFFTAYRLGLYRIQICPDIRPIILSDTRYPAKYLI